jgi:hypothetical protein
MDNAKKPNGTSSECHQPYSLHCVFGIWVIKTKKSNMVAKKRTSINQSLESLSPKEKGKM